MTDKGQLNREIAEKLMGFELREAHWWVDRIGMHLSEGLPNYFTEGWEAVEDKLAELGLHASTSPLTQSKRYSTAILDTMYSEYSIRETRELARYEALKQAWPEILKRLAND